METAQSHDLLTNTAKARELFFEYHIEPCEFVSAPILNSWTRCARDNRSPYEPVQFTIKNDKHERVELNRNLIEDFETTLASFSGLLRKSGFFPILTDASATTIARYCDIKEANGNLYRALQIGSDMSEEAIGTAAMNCALISGTSVQVLGGQHYFEANAGFSCAAAPIYTPTGKIAGAINLTKHQESREFGALSFVESCANAVERMQLERVPSHVVLRVLWSANGESRNASVAFGAAGELLGMTRQASRILNPCRVPTDSLVFEDIFDGHLGSYVQELSKHKRPLLARLSSGLFVFIEMLKGPGSSLSFPNLGLKLIEHPVEELNESVPEMGDPRFIQQFKPAVKALKHGLSVMVIGETGTGKEVTARALHSASRPNKEFVAINCAAVPEALIEAELFGYADGTFTGGRKGGSAGRIEEANGGTLFLDEIGDMPLCMQARLLRVLDCREVVRLGSGKAIPVDFQLICATHQDLEEMMCKGTFRSDLYYRISGYVVTLAPLRQRTGLANFLRILVEEHCRHEAGIDKEALEMMVHYPWPGNTRQAISVVKRAIISADTAVPIGLKDIASALHPMSLPVEHRRAKNPGSPISLETAQDQAIVEALRIAGGNISHAANQLGISRSTLQRKLRRRPDLLS